MTAFLGYYNSPIWFKLNHILDISFLIKCSSSHIVSLFTILFLISFILFYLDDFKLSSVYIIKCFQIFSFIGILFTLIVALNITNHLVIPCYIIDKDSVDVHGHVHVTKEAGKAIGQGLNTIGTNLGLGATIAGVSAAVAKGITKSSLPPLQKASIIVGAGLIGGMSHSKISTINRNNVLEENLKNGCSNNSSNLDSSVNKLIDDSLQSSPLQDLLSNLEITNYIFISMVILLIIQIIFKFHLKDDVNLNILGVNINYYLNKIISLNKKMSVLYIWLILITLIIGLSFSAYACNDLCNNLESYINVHNNLKK